MTLPDDIIVPQHGNNAIICQGAETQKNGSKHMDHIDCTGTFELSMDTGRTHRE